MPPITPTGRKVAKSQGLKVLLLALLGMPLYAQETPRQLSGIYPHLSYANNEGECGTGAVVPWADRLWVITYGPHKPFGSSDKLYEFTPDLKQLTRAESIGGTPANRMIHRETNQLLIGPYLIDAKRNVRVLPWEKMPGRLTGNARHLSDPARKAYYATMEEGLYEVDLTTLDVHALIKDGNPDKGKTSIAHPSTVNSVLPGYHGKGLYSGQGRVIYSNNGEDKDKRALSDPTTPSGALAEWSQPGDWKLIRRNQFTDVTGPGGIEGNPNPDTDPVWSIGWDHRSLILMCLDKGSWFSYRLPKGSHSYDGAHGWNTEWPRIRDIGENDLLMTMHGMFWRFPKSFSSTQSAGIAPRSSYLKVVGDFCRWQNRIILGCDDTAKNEFLNKRTIKAAVEAPQSQSNLWFLEPAQLDQLGPLLARGSLWLNEDVAPNQPSDPFLFSGFPKRSLHLAHEGTSAVNIRLEIDAKGDGNWSKFQEVALEPHGYTWVDLSNAPAAPWIRLVCDSSLTQVTASFHYSQKDSRTPTPANIFDGIASAADSKILGGSVRALGDGRRTLTFAPQLTTPKGVEDIGLYELDANLNLRPIDAKEELTQHQLKTPLTTGALASDAASVLVVDDKGKRWRLPRASQDSQDSPALQSRIAREVATERDLFNAFGTFYELPAENAGGFAKMRPISTHGRQIIDFCSYRGLLILTGLSAADASQNPHIIRSQDGRAALWAGAIDDLWTFGKVRGFGGPWKDTQVQANQASDPYLMNGYDSKTLTLQASKPVTIHVEVNLEGNSVWKTYRSFEVPADKPLVYEFPEAFQAVWIRTSASDACTASAQLEYR